MMFGEMAVSYDLQDIDYEELRDFVHRSFVDMWGGEVVSWVEVAHFNPSMIDVTVYVRKRRAEMREYGLRLSKGFRSQGIPTAISVVEEKERT